MILFVTTKNVFLQHGGGAETTFNSLLMWQAEKNIAFAYINRSRLRSKTPRDQNIHRARIPFLAGRNRSVALAFLDDLIIFAILRFLCWRHGVSSVFMFFERSLLRPILWLKASGKGPKIVLRIAGPSWAEKADEKPRRMAEYKRMFEAADRINCLSAFQAQQFLAHCEERGIQIAKDTVFVADVLRPPEATGRYVPPARNGVAKLAMAARMTAYQKRQDILIRSMSHDAAMPSQLTLFGDGARRAELEQLAKDEGLGGKVIFRGTLAQKDFQASLSEFDLFCLCSDYEGTSKALLEAMAIGIPCLVSAVEPMISDFAELADQGGIILVENTPASWAQAVRLAMADPEKAREMTETARAFVAAHYTSDAVFQRFLDGVRGEG